MHSPLLPERLSSLWFIVRLQNWSQITSTSVFFAFLTYHRAHISYWHQGKHIQNVFFLEFSEKNSPSFVIIHTSLLIFSHNFRPISDILVAFTHNFDSVDYICILVLREIEFACFFFLPWWWMLFLFYMISWWKEGNINMHCHVWLESPPKFLFENYPFLLRPITTCWHHMDSVGFKDYFIKEIETITLNTHRLSFLYLDTKILRPKFS